MIEETGKRVRAFRTAKHLSMSELSKSIGISKSLISQVERGEVLPSLTTLEKIATALEVPLSKFFSAGIEDVEKDDIIVHKNKRKIVQIPGSNSNYHVLTPSLHSEIEFLLIEYPPNNTQDYFSHDGKEYFYVLEGELELTVGQRTYQLHEGDSGSFESSNVHYFINHSKNIAKIIIFAIKPSL